jgi:trimeric autotransporter adhesin
VSIYRRLVVFGFMVFALAGGTALAAPPAAPSLVAPPTGVSVTIPLTISWSAADPSGVGGYNWEVSLSSDFASVIERNPRLLVGAATTSDVVSGLANGTYFWRVQAVSRDLELGAWSPARSFVVTGAGAGVPGTAVLNPPHDGTRFHMFETVTFSWSAVPGAVDYILQESTDPTFPTDTRVRQVNIPGPTERISFNAGNLGNFTARVIAVGPDGLMGTPSNLVEFSVLDSNPFPSPPTLSGPINGATHQLPLTLSWTHVPNHQDLGYQVEIASSSSFTTIESSFRVTENRKIVPTLTAGTKFWRVRSQHGYIGATEAYTAWSATGTFTVQAAPLRMGAVTFPETKFSGGEARGAIDLTGPAPAGGAIVTFSTSHPSLLPELPEFREIVAGDSAREVLVAPTGTANSLRGMRVGFVTAPTLVTVTATYNGTSASTDITLLPPKLNDTPLQLCPQQVTGGGETCGIVDLEIGCFAGICDGLTPPGGFGMSLSSSSPAVTVPATFTLLEGQGGNSFPIQTSPVTKVTNVTVTARAGDTTASLRYRLTPPPTPSSLTLQPVTTASGSQGVVRVPSSAIAGHDQLVRVSSSNPGVASVPSFATILASNDIGRFDIVTSPVLVSTVVTITVTGGGVTLTADLTVAPNVPALTALTVSPTSVSGGTSATGTVTLGSAAPAGGVAVSLGSNLPGSASVPPTVTVPGGATSATFAVTTFPVDATTVQLSATLGSVTQFASLGITRSPALSALGLSPAIVVGGNSSTGTVTLVEAAPSGGTVVTLSDDSALATTPASVTVAAGATSRTFTVTTTAVTAQTPVVITGSSGGATRSATFTVNPPTPAAPTLQSPANDATNVTQPVLLDWSDVANATSYEVQMDNSSTIAAPFTANPTVSVSQVSIGGLPAQRLWWRVRAKNAAGVFGPFSSTRRFTPQAATTTPSLSALALSPASLVGGGSSTGTVTLTAAAPSGGAVVTLTSANAAASVPASVTVAAGATTATFTATTTTVAAQTAATITGAWNGVNRTATLTVNPAASLTSLSLSPASLTGGSSSTGTVTLTSAAPSGGVVVNLSSGSAVAAVPATVTVAAGATSATFTATTASVTAQATVTITATADVSRTATLTVNPASSGALAAPTLSSPANDARFDQGQTIVFDWSDVAGAAGYTIQIDDQDTFPSPTVNQTVTQSTYSTNTLPVTRMWWRVRANDASGNPGAWSAVRRFEVR